MTADSVSLTEHTGLDGRWRDPLVLDGPDGVPWLIAVNDDRRMVFAFRIVSGELQQAHEARSIFHVTPAEHGGFDENLAPLEAVTAEAGRHSVALSLRSTPDLGMSATYDLPATTGLDDTPGLLMLDTTRIAGLAGVRRVLNRPVKHPANPIMVPGEPGASDELRVFNRGTVMIESGTFRMWYAGAQHPGSRDDLREHFAGANWQKLMHVCYAESDDGVEWRKPELGLVEFGGDTRNNLLPGLWRMPTIVRTDRTPVPGEPYVCTEQLQTATPEQAVLHTSADGLSWNTRPAERTYPGSRPFYFEYDSVFFDEVAGLWRAYGNYGPGPTRRTGGMATSEDLIHWEGYPENPIVDPLQLPETRVHDFVVWQEMGMFVGMLEVGPAPASYEFALMLSRDGIHFRRPDPTGLFLGCDPEGWDKGMMLMASAPVAVGDEWWLYYSSLWPPMTPDEPAHAIFYRRMSAGLATIRRGGYAHCEPADASAPGLVTTVPLTCASPGGWRLACNATVAGSLRVEVLDASTGRPLPGHGLDEAAPVAGDGLELPVAWRGGDVVQVAPDRPVALRFELRGAGTRLYGVSWQRA
ncbi:MAG: hypothetical protein J7M38_02345 [Armatimonadetes bacterium]|nr:hypothetical protein [Armatimonadota bacterium]